MLETALNLKWVNSKFEFKKIWLILHQSFFNIEDKIWKTEILVWFGFSV